MAGKEGCGSLPADDLPNRILHSADGILELILGLLGHSFGFRLLVAHPRF